MLTKHFRSELFDDSGYVYLTLIETRMMCMKVTNAWYPPIVRSIYFINENTSRKV